MMSHPEREDVALPSLKGLFPERVFPLPPPSKLTNVREKMSIANLTLPPLRLGNTRSQQDNDRDLDKDLTLPPLRLNVYEQTESVFPPEPSQTRKSAPLRKGIKKTASGNVKQRVLGPQGKQKDRFLCPQPLCGVSLSRSNDLKRHQELHNRQQTFTCSFPKCAYSTNQKSNVTLHEKIHVPLINREATLCPFLGLEECEFVTRAAHSVTGTIKRHMEKKHSKELVERFANMRKGKKAPRS